MTLRISDDGTSRSMPAASVHDLGLPEVSFTVAAGECLAVLGRSGSGKSSLLRTLAGLHPAEFGRIHVNGRDVSALRAEQRGIVYLHQEPVLFPHLSVLQNVAFPMRIRGVPARDAERRAFEMLVRLQVGTVGGNRPDALSGGQRHRVALARALCADPAVLLLDEPLASLDPAVRRDVREALLAVREVSRAAMLLVTHDLDDAMSIATQVTTITDQQQLTPPMTPAALLQSPPMLQTARLLGVFSEIRGVVTHETALQFTWIGGRLAAPGLDAGDAVACVRSHEVDLRPGDVPGALDASVLTVTRRRDAAHEVLLELHDAAGAPVTLRVASDSLVQAGDRVQVQVRHARIFAAD
ncbi:MAG TPA: ABC transporter ATP-binding protein [Gemmatimonadaceae bacterium]|nr:ABC transporter ATP-binding protein [Gemmatimonadaceae bacterium]